MDAVTDSYLHDQLVDRRNRLEEAIGKAKDPQPIVHLLEEVDSALGRMDEGAYGMCEECHDAIEKDRLIADPLLRFCLDHLSAAERRALQEDLDLAARVQEALLPKKDVTTHGWDISYHYQPLGPVSGDYCDLVIPATEERDVFLLVGDVSGKGVAASMLMSHLHAMFRSLIAVGLSVDQVVQRANRLFCESIMAGSFATIVCGRASASGEVEVCNAGHCPPLLVGQGEVSIIEAAGLPIGMFCEGDYSSRTIKLEPGDSLVLVTDGLTEARSSSGVEYGLERLGRLLKHNQDGRGSRQIIAACLEDLAEFMSRASATDDLTVMVVRRSGPAVGS